MYITVTRYPTKELETPTKIAGTKSAPRGTLEITTNRGKFLTKQLAQILGVKPSVLCDRARSRCGDWLHPSVILPSRDRITNKMLGQPFMYDGELIVETDRGYFTISDLAVIKGVKRKRLVDRIKELGYDDPRIFKRKESQIKDEVLIRGALARYSTTRCKRHIESIKGLTLLEQRYFG